MNAPTRPFSALIGAMNPPPRAIGRPAAPSHRAPLSPPAAPWPAAKVNSGARNPMTRDANVIGRGEPLGFTTAHQRIEAGATIDSHFRAKAARGEFGTYDDTRRTGAPQRRAKP
ncbi:MAG: hypothetical protein Q8M24_08370 [Pseudolabrys sp.]|nr:hypothetical protein [Pseudolabrys sp.]MDP2295461.1 hypothetical protein [Pseudolabrys sp.]